MCTNIETVIASHASFTSICCVYSSSATRMEASCYTLLTYCQQPTFSFLSSTIPKETEQWLKYDSIISSSRQSVSEPVLINYAKKNVTQWQLLPVKLNVGNFVNSSPFAPYTRASFSSSSAKCFSTAGDASTNFPPLALSRNRVISKYICMQNQWQNCIFITQILIKCAEQKYSSSTTWQLFSTWTCVRRFLLGFLPTFVLEDSTWG